MKRLVFAVVILAGLAGCGGSNLLDMVPAFDSTSHDDGLTPEQAAAIDKAVTGFEIVVPDTLKVSEADSLFPRADIVWRGDLPGDRHDQIAAIYADAATAVVGPSIEERSGLIMTIEVTRFHGLTERARFSFVGGNYSLRFDITLRDAATGAIVAGPRGVKADTKASGGIRALYEEMNGRTEKVVVTERLVHVLDIVLAEMVLNIGG
ncbi:MAG: DUF6778 family protein [Paracoccaceae bacterium]